MKEKIKNQKASIQIPKSTAVLIIVIVIIVAILGILLYSSQPLQESEIPQGIEIDKPPIYSESELKTEEDLDYSILKAEKDLVVNTETYHILIDKEKPSEHQLKSLAIKLGHNKYNILYRVFDDVGAHKILEKYKGVGKSLIELMSQELLSSEEAEIIENHYLATYSKRWADLNTLTLRSKIYYDSEEYEEIKKTEEKALKLALKEDDSEFLKFVASDESKKFRFKTIKINNNDTVGTRKNPSNLKVSFTAYNNGAHFRIKNNNDFNWEIVLIVINGEGRKNSIGGYYYIATQIEKQSSIKVSGKKFINDEDEFFNPLIKVPQRVYIQAHTKNGFSEYYGFLEEK